MLDLSALDSVDTWYCCVSGIYIIDQNSISQQLITDIGISK
jgi:hypothetical protein